MFGMLDGFNPRARTGRDQYNLSVAKSGLGFNPRARTGRDYTPLNKPSCQKSVSIHAPARGATYGVQVYYMHKDMFQSTRPHGA